MLFNIVFRDILISKKYLNSENVKIINQMNIRDSIVDNYINFKKILTQENKELESVHSGNVNKIKLPCKLPYLTMFRVENISENIE